MTPFDFTGFEHGADPTSLTGLWADMGGVAPTVTSAAARSGGYGLRLSPISGTASFVAPFVNAGANLDYAGSVYFRMPSSLPAQTSILFWLDASVGGFNFKIDTAGHLICDDGGAHTVTTTGTYAAGSFVRIDFVRNLRSTQYVDWSVNGVAQTRVTSTFGAGANCNLYLGTFQSTTPYTCDYDDVCVSVTAADYPIGETISAVDVISASGTHNLEASPSSVFFYFDGATTTAISTGETASYQELNTLPIDGDGHYVREGGTPPDTTKYVEYVFTSGSLTPLAVSAVIAYHNVLSTTASTLVVKLFDALQGTNLEDVFNASITNTIASGGVKYARKLFNQRPNSGGAWTQAALNALRTRMGFSTAVAGQPAVRKIVLEILTQPVTTQFSRPASDLATGGWAPTPSSPTTLFDKIDESIADDADYISATAT